MILDEYDNPIENPDINLGNLEQLKKKVFHTYILDTPEETHEEVIKEYPNGGKDIKIVVDQEEVGHYETRDEDGNILEHFDGDIPEGFPHDVTIESAWEFQRYTKYTEEELAAIAEQKRLEQEQAEKEAAETAERETFLSSAAEIQAQQDAAICELYELIAGGDE